MKLNVYRKICTLEGLTAQAEAHRQAGKKLVLCHGCFDIVHPGHLRYLQFAHAQGDVLIVTLTADDAIEKADGTRPYVPQELRAEALAALEIVDQVAVIEGPTAEPVIKAIRPDIYIKGKEYEDSTHPGFVLEKQLVEALGGRVMYSSGDVIFSSTAILDQYGAEHLEKEIDPRLRLGACCRRWGIDKKSVGQMIREGFAGKKVAVIGDALLDHYIFCDAGERSGEAPILTVRPQEEAKYPGGAAVIACHVQALGGQAHLITALGEDAAGKALGEELRVRGIVIHELKSRKKLPTKTRYLVETQKLLKVDDAAAQPLDSRAQKRMLARLEELKTEVDGAIFVDFGCGVLSPGGVTHGMQTLRDHVKIIAGDVSGTRRTLLSFKGADLLTPHERELRSVLGDFENSLPGVAMQLMRELGVGNLAVTLGGKGCVLFRPRESEKQAWFEHRLRSEYMPALAETAVDPVGAGDALLATATLALTAGASLTQAGYLGSAAAALEVGRLGNQTVSSADLLQYLRGRVELNDAIAAAG